MLCGVDVDSVVFTTLTYVYKSWSAVGIKRRFLVVKVHLNVIEDYVKKMAGMHYRIGQLQDGSKHFVWVRMRLWTCTTQDGCPFFKIRRKRSPFIDDGWTVRELSVEVVLSRAVARSIAVISNKHLANGILRLPNRRQKCNDRRTMN